MGAGLEEARVAEDEDAIARGDGGRAVGRGNDGALTAGAFDPIEEGRRLLVVQRTRRLVEHEDRRVAHQGAREGDSLALPARKRPPAFADERPIPVGEPLDELASPRQLGGLRHVVRPEPRIAERDVVVDGRR